MLRTFCRFHAERGVDHATQLFRVGDRACYDSAEDWIGAVAESGLHVVGDLWALVGGRAGFPESVGVSDPFSVDSAGQAGCSFRRGTLARQVETRM